MKNILLLTGIISCTCCFAGSVDTIPANDGSIEYTGRIDFTDPLAPAFSYSGVTIRTCFTGTGIAMIMNDDIGQNYYNIILDGKLLDTIRITTGKKTYKIADGLENITHEIEIFKRTEQMFGKTRFFGFVVDQGSVLTPITNIRTRLIEYIGNSITCGYGNEGLNGGTFGPTTENHYMTYAAITSRNFNARHLAVCKSGIGIYRNYDGPAAGNADCMTNYYTRVYLYDENPKYSFSNQPDLVCIDLGTNDFSTGGGDSTRFVSNYFRLLDTIQTKYTMPDILCLLGPMIGDPSLTKMRKYLQYIADSATRKGMGSVYFFEMSQQTGALGIGIDYHPTVAQHKKNGMELTGYIKSLKGWKINPLVINANVTGARHVEIEFNTPVHDSLNTFAGFAVYGDSVQYSISSVYTDTANNKIVHILLQEPISVEEKIYLGYSPGSLVTVDSIPVGSISSLTVQNNLTITKIARGATSADGTRVILTFNKNVSKNSTIEGLSLTCSKGIIVIDSFSIKSNQFTLYCKDAIMKGDSVFADYSGTNIFGEDEIPLDSFSGLVIKNSSTYTGISENTDDCLIIYPNPSRSGIFGYRLNNSLITGNPGLEVINGNGTTVHRQTLSGTEGQINLCNHLKTGIYFFKLTADNSVFISSVIKE